MLPGNVSVSSTKELSVVRRIVEAHHPQIPLLIVLNCCSTVLTAAPGSKAESDSPVRDNAPNKLRLGSSPCLKSLVFFHLPLFPSMN